MAIKDCFLSAETRNMVYVEVLSHARMTKEDVPFICMNLNCAAYGKTHYQRARVYHDCTVRYPDGVERDWQTFYAIQERCPRCSR